MSTTDHDRSSNDPTQSRGRDRNAAEPIKGAEDASPDRYPDAEGTRSFEPKVRNETAPETPPAGPDRLGPGGDPAEGKR